MNRKSMMMLSRKAHLRFAFCLLVLGLLSACVSKGPATRFYSFFPSQTVDVKSNRVGSLGVGPVVLPEYLENPSVVSLTDGQRLRVSGYHAWAGGLKEAITRVAADDLAQSFPGVRVAGFPWDNRVRPDLQLRLRFSEFAGKRGGEIRSSIFWTLLHQRGEVILAEGVVRNDTVALSSDVEAYVRALNMLLNQAMETIAADTAAYLNP